MNRQELMRSAERFTDGAEFITVAQFQRWLGVGRHGAESRLAGLPKVFGKYFYLPEVVDKMIKEME